MNLARTLALSCSLTFSVGLGLIPAWGTLPAMAADSAAKGTAFPDLKAFNLEGKLPDTTGKVVVVDFWASWCGPCKKAMPILKDLQGVYKDKPVVFIGISLDESKSDMDEFLTKNPMPFAMLRDPKGKLAETLKIEGIPASFVIDTHGKITGTHTGLTSTLKQDYIREIESSLSAATAK